MTVHSEHDLGEALRAIESTSAKCEKALTSLKAGTAQHTLLTRRIAAFAIAIKLLKEKLGE
jgi:hypothetical protein